MDESGINLAAKDSDLIKGILQGVKPKESKESLTDVLRRLVEMSTGEDTCFATPEPLLATMQQQ